MVGYHTSLFSGKLSPNSNQRMWFWGFKTASGKVMQVGEASKSRAKAVEKMKAWQKQGKI